MPRANQSVWVYSPDGKKLLEEKIADAQGIVDLGVQPEKFSIGFSLKAESINSQTSSKLVQSFFVYKTIDNTQDIITIDDTREGTTSCANKTRTSIIASIPNKLVERFYLESAQFQTTQVETSDVVDGKLGVFDLCYSASAALSPASIRMVATAKTGETYLYTANNFNLADAGPLRLSAQERSELANISINSEIPLRIFGADPSPNGDDFALDAEGKPVPKTLKQSYFPSEHSGGLTVSFSAVRQDGAFLSYSASAAAMEAGFSLNVPALTDTASYLAENDSFIWSVSAQCPGLYNSISMTKNTGTSKENGFDVTTSKRVEIILPAGQTEIKVPELPAEFTMRPADTGVKLGYFFYVYPQDGSGVWPNCAKPTKSWVSLLN